MAKLACKQRRYEAPLSAINANLSTGPEKSILLTVQPLDSSQRVL
jgi:hypothetical protein